jgi:hypothetical protein
MLYVVGYLFVIHGVPGGILDIRRLQWLKKDGEKITPKILIFAVNTNNQSVMKVYFIIYYCNKYEKKDLQTITISTISNVLLKIATFMDRGKRQFFFLATMPELEGWAAGGPS